MGYFVCKCDEMTSKLIENKKLINSYILDTRVELEV